MEDAGPSNFGLMDEFLAGDNWIENPEFLDLFQPSTCSTSSPLGFFPAFESENNNSFHPVLEERPEEIGGAERENDLELACRIPTTAPIIPVKERLHLAFNYMKKESDVLIQIWMVTTIGNHRQVLTTYGMPFWYDPNIYYRSLEKYRSVSEEYVFSTNKNNSDIPMGLPGRVFQDGVPKWTPDVKYFSFAEYLRVKHAQNCDVGGTVAIPIFERGSKSCAGVVEVISAAPKIDFSSDLENICNALQAVDLSSTNYAPNAPSERNDSYRALLPEILAVLRAACETHGLPLAQTWTSCIQQGKQGIRHSEENYTKCVSTIDAACYVNDTALSGFHRACSNHHLFRGQGLVGEAFTTNQPRFSPDITSFIWEKYPLSHYAKFFHLRAAVAIRLRSIHCGNDDFVLEFFLPINCVDREKQISMLHSLSITMQQVCQSLRVVTAMELEDEGVMEAQVKEAANSIMLPSFMEFSNQGIEEVNVTTSKWGPRGDHRNIFSKLKQLGQDVGKDTNWDHSSEPKISVTGKVTEKRRAKPEKTVSLQVLRQYFAGSLRDAAKSLGVCPATLQKICRQHGITRWPSRKIKKVGHSLKKLQVVIDSVQGTERTFQFSSLYENFIKPSESEPNKQLSTPEPSRHPESSNSISSPSGHSSSSNFDCSTGSKQQTHAPRTVMERQVANIERTCSNILVTSVSPEDFAEHLSSENQSQPHRETETALMKVKAAYGEEKVRLRLQPEWGFQELKQEIAKRFGISDLSLVDLKYLDDDSEWVLLTCDADLEECIDVYTSSSVGTIRISVHRVALPGTRVSFGCPLLL